MSKPTPTLVDLIKDHIDSKVDHYEGVTIRWNGSDTDRRSGYLTVEYKVWDSGAMSYAGMHHPDDGSCVGEGVCIYCGRTLGDFDD